MSLFCEYAAKSGDMARNMISAILHGVSAGRHYQCVSNIRMGGGLVQFNAVGESCLVRVVSHLAKKKNWTAIPVTKVSSQWEAS